MSPDMTKRTSKLSFAERTAKLSFAQQELAVTFYDVACDQPSETFAQIAKRVMPQGWIKASAAFRREARKMFNNAR
jgi:hypothetical protein